VSAISGGVKVVIAMAVAKTLIKLTNVCCGTTAALPLPHARFWPKADSPLLSVNERNPFR